MHWAEIFQNKECIFMEGVGDSSNTSVRFIMCSKPCNILTCFVSDSWTHKWHTLNGNEFDIPKSKGTCLHIYHKACISYNWFFLLTWSQTMNLQKWIRDKTQIWKWWNQR